MKAVVCDRYGPPDVLRLVDMERPEPGDKEILVKIHATAVTTGDCNARGFTFAPPGLRVPARLMLGLRRPKQPILGMDLAGEVEAVGRDVESFTVGDPVFGGTGIAFGAYAEYTCLKEGGQLAIKPARLSFEDAAAIPFGAITALFFLRDKARLKAGQRVLVNGASGGVGVYAVQLAKYFGAEVTGVCSAANMDLVRSLGADSVIDYTQVDFRQSGRTWDVILDSVCGNVSFSAVKKALEPKGLYLAVAGGLKELLQTPLMARSKGRRVIAAPAPDRREDLVFVGDLVEAGHLKPVIDRRYPLEEIVEAHRHVDRGHKRGSVVITV